MDLIDQLKAIAARIPQQIPHTQTEEATKNAFVMPFIRALGYDIFDPTEVVPELVADVGVKKGEKVDYAIMKEGRPIILFECKWCGVNLDDVHPTQLYRYFSATDARIAVLTNGIEYRFYTDLDEPNKMDAKPFLVFNMADVQESSAAELKKLAKGSFDEAAILSTASELKYTREIKRFFAQQLATPSDEFIRFVSAHIYSGKLTQRVLADFKPTVLKAFRQFISEQINERLRTALEQPTPEAQPAPPGTTAPEAPGEDTGIVTTAEEIEGLFVVRAIVCDTIDPNRVVARDVRSYFGVLLDDNNRKPICRLYLHGSKKYIGLFDAGKNEERQPLESPQVIYRFASRLRETVQRYESPPG